MRFLPRTYNLLLVLGLLTYGYGQGGKMMKWEKRKQTTPTESYIHRVVLDETYRYVLFWKFDSNSITFETHVHTNGWVGFGISPTGGMRGSDVVMGWIKDGIINFSDRHAVGHALPKKDGNQDYELLLAKEINGSTIFKFRRPLSTCDPHDGPIQDGTIRVIYAWGDDDPINEDDLRYLYHYGNRGAKSVVLLDYNSVVKKRMAPEQRTNIQYFDTLMENVTLPDDDTIYWCKFFRLPDLARKHHIISVEPRIEDGHEALLHHVVVYLCNQWDTSIKTKKGERCYHNNMPPNVTACDSVVFGYAVGMQELVFPENAGFPIGRPNDPKFMYLEVHYDNPRRLKGLRDNSGLRFYFTPELREHDAGVLEIGHTVWWPQMLIPPRAKDFKVNTFCSSKCTQKFMPETGIKFIAIFLHTHLAGHRIWMKHVRNGTELPEIARDDHYDFNFQQFRLLPREVTILPGDEIITTCSYKTRKRKKMTYGGLSTREEMCFNFVMYYPKIDLTKCLSTVFEWTEIHDYIKRKADKGEVVYDQYNARDNFFDYLNDVKWTKREISRFQRVIDKTEQYREYCEREGSGAGPMVSNKFEYLPKVHVKERYKRKVPCTASNVDVYKTIKVHDPPSEKTASISGNPSSFPCKLMAFPMAITLTILLSLYGRSAFLVV